MQKQERLPNDEDVEIRRRAVEDIRGKSPDIIIPALLKAMEDPSWRVRKAAAEILMEGCPPEQYINGLLQLLYIEDNAGARNSAIDILVKIGKKATPFLIEAFNTTNRDVRKFIIDIIGTIKDRKALPLLLGALKDDDDNIRASSVEYLGEMGEPTVTDALIGILQSNDVWTAYPAADALGRIGDRRAVPALINALSVKALREPVLKALGRLSAPETLGHVVPFLMDASKSIQEEAVKTIELFYHNRVTADFICDSILRICGQDITKRLISLAWSKKPDVRAAAILILGIMRDEETFIPLLELSEDENFTDEVRRALIFIGKSKPAALKALFETDNITYKRFVAEVAAQVASPSYYGFFEALTTDRDGHLRSLAADGLSNIGEKKAVRPLMKLFSDPYEDVQESAVKALGNFREHLSTGEIISYLKDKNPDIRKNAVLLLGRIGADNTVDAIGFALKDEAVAVREAVVSALSSIKTDESIRYLTVALTDEDPFIRASAALSLGAIGICGEKTSESLVLLLSDTDDSVRVAAVRALGIAGDTKAMRHLINMLKDTNGFVVTTSLEALSKLGGSEAREAITKMLDSGDIEIKRTAIRSLSAFRGVEGIILPYLKDRDWATRMAAIEALSRAPEERIIKEMEKLIDTEEDPVVRKALEEFLNVR